MEHLPQQYRHLFPILQTHTMLASCSQSALAEPVSRAIQDYHDSLLYKGTNWKEAIEKTEFARNEFAKLIGAEPDEVAIVPSVSDALVSVASSLTAFGKKHVVYTDMDFPAVPHVWQAHSDYTVSVIPSIDGVLPLEQYETHISDETVLTCVPHVHYRDGYVQDIKAIAEISQRKGSLLFVDAYQSAGHIPIDVKEWGVDMLAAGTRKYLLGIPGVAFLYVRKELADALKPKASAWFGRENGFDGAYAKGARRFQTGTPAFISVYAAAAALSLLNHIGVSHIRDHVKTICADAVQYAAEKGLQLAAAQGGGQPGMVAIRDERASETVALLKKKKVICAPRENVIRLAPHFYNTKEEMRRAIDEIAAKTIHK
ncbi:aminotransferase class V-fold PLP-dependent enzyme [Bacillus subtilis]|uniref:aminotransferase class V-fold PLP-dependent enzyme n=1 Tax=Bacillus subtilis TaxID=1423 RepID=UPI002115F1A0|nr:aminotransferase class V-fold PLP-dependent enzyme [Bacillus subtilis]UUH70807.1 aminotransferase class V-fold PLP-dependent enzyme [Bacillus subtilis subsp. subtilis]UUH82827.1 aminotransferase class V-fold PLP-dependent enzyme [Bacillus subtilis]UUI49292.1 aminotransferase class V-fold PLP-dependent enzyme [Bacillus subtilis]